MTDFSVFVINDKKHNKIKLIKYDRANIVAIGSQMTENEEMNTVAFMITLFCRKKHKSQRGRLCPDCAFLLEYVRLRREKCPWGKDKPFCSCCPIHCYRSDMREKIKEVMRFSGPRMLIYHPIMAIRHMAATIKQKRKTEKRRSRV